MGTLSLPVPILASHGLGEFCSGEEILDHWLKRRALKNEAAGASRTYVVCDGLQVVGYYALATGSAMLDAAPGKIRRNMPDPIPLIILGRLATDVCYQGQGLGRGLLKDALLRSLQVAQQVGVRALLVHALSEQAKQFYLHHGFVESPLDGMKLFLPLQGLVV
ncbi:GNAT family N-acetyltransferase [Thiothrix sp.]|jgi:GNAT superfamily N-acetyltransferase|uniref:GNAT family N-acetyltransferase n=1 Tax=Thiothrix sp. TaxID=1032 RepID=UPI002579DE08|nr:GNAT family N-acetyltransferase [Thiothrix sp.]